MQSLYRRGVTCIALVLGLMAPPGEARATFLEIDFDFTDQSFVSLLGGVIVTPPDGSFDSGSARVRVDASDLSTPIPGGDVTFDQADFAGSVFKVIPEAAFILGSFEGVQIGTLDGTLAPGEMGVDFAEDIILDLDIALACAGVGCDLLGFPIDVTGISSLAITFMSFTDLNSPGDATISAILPIELDGVLGVLTLVVNEQSRQFIPEPQTATLLVIGLALLKLSRPRVR